jgi:hypothetical protein
VKNIIISKVRSGDCFYINNLVTIFFKNIEWFAYIKGFWKWNQNRISYKILIVQWVNNGNGTDKHSRNLVECWIYVLFKYTFNCVVNKQCTISTSGTFSPFVTHTYRNTLMYHGKVKTFLCCSFLLHRHNNNNIYAYASNIARFIYE